MTYDQYCRRLYLSYLAKRRQDIAPFAIWWNELDETAREIILPWRIILEDVPGWCHLKDLYSLHYELPRLP